MTNGDTYTDAMGNVHNPLVATKPTQNDGQPNPDIQTDLRYKYRDDNRPDIKKPDQPTVDGSPLIDEKSTEVDNVDQPDSDELVVQIDTTASFADNRFNRFDYELIDRYFNDEGKAAILARDKRKELEARIDEHKVIANFTNEKLEDMSTSNRVWHANKKVAGRLAELRAALKSMEDK
jgi:hypothetical protein